MAQTDRHFHRTVDKPNRQDFHSDNVREKYFENYTNSTTKKTETFFFSGKILLFFNYKEACHLAVTRKSSVFTQENIQKSGAVGNNYHIQLL